MAWNEWEVYQDKGIQFEVAVEDGVQWPTNEYIVTVEQSAEEYDGPYSFTPTNQVQTVGTQDRLLLENITIEPIPSNYGLITWNGSILTVS